MVRTQIQLPDRLYKRLKAIAEQRELPLTEVVRRGMEKYAATCAEGGDAPGEWEFPTLEPREMIAGPENIRSEADAIEGRLQ